MSAGAGTVFVLSGGAVRAAVQAGMLQALAEAGIFPDALVGTSAGALNAAYIAGYPLEQGIRQLPDVWRRLRRRDVFPVDLGETLQGLMGRQNHFFPPDGMRDWIARYLTYERLEESRVPLRVVCADAHTGEEVVLDSGHAAEVVLASVALPVAYPPVMVGGRALIDGGVTQHSPLDAAMAMNPSRVFVLPAGSACALGELRVSPMAMGLHALNLLIKRQLVEDLEDYAGEIPIHVVPPFCPGGICEMDFDAIDALIAGGLESTRDWLARGMPPARL
jgi:NTE family protein